MQTFSYLHVVICSALKNFDHRNIGNYILRRRSTATWAESLLQHLMAPWWGAESSLVTYLNAYIKLDW